MAKPPSWINPPSWRYSFFLDLSTTTQHIISITIKDSIVMGNDQEPTYYINSQPITNAPTLAIFSKP
ncbi:hypothetical protein L6452_40025 [Arctium lappa]|uniref:Uncharacterized protein n=1 Tax=Arctium lappa TaxID=4217 RepID=A0ACB8XUT0_ARCLA|nr:hypothetical protein L6452_40025 [Arctium lappa]